MLLCLGGEGFIGRNILENLEGSFQCVSASLTSSVFPYYKRVGELVKINPYQKVFTAPYDILVHLIDNKNETGDFEGAEKILLGNICAGKAKHIIVFSSAVVYADPNSDYGHRKRSLERVYQEYCAVQNIKLTIFRLFNVFGAYQLPFRQGSLIANLVFNHLRGQTSEIRDIQASRDFLFAGDIAQFIQLAIDQSIVGTHDIASYQPRKIGEIISLLEGQVFQEELKIKNLYDRETRISPEAKKTFGNASFTPIVSALEKTAEFYRNNQALIEEVLTATG